jgi:signal transduction histidine kinase
VACRWRIRHKLWLGLGLVAALVAVLLGGALKGLDSYRKTIKNTDSRLIELDHAIKLRSLAQKLSEPIDDKRKEANLFQMKLEALGKALAEYEKAVKERGQYGVEPGQSVKVTYMLQALGQKLKVLDDAVKDAVNNNTFLSTNTPKVVHTTNEAIDDLIAMIYKDSYDRFEVAKADHRFSLTVVLATSAFGVLLMAGLLRFFYRWVFYPIRDLQQAVHRVGQGDFDYTIALHSGDEIEDLAARFNEMTARLREMYHDLARQVNERSRQLVRSERLAGVGFLAAGVAHEINNPLASIAFCSEALERRLSEVLGGLGRPGEPEGEDVEVVRKYLRMIQQEAFRCKEITQRLLEFSRGGQKRREPTDLGELIQGVLDVAQHLQNCKGKRLVFTPPARLVAWVNAQEIKSVVLNLVVNALDSMEDGGTLTITARLRDGMAELGFADTGCGMTAEVLENIFEPFFTRSRTGKGTGLGLSISHRIISQHRGEIEAVSPGPSRGSTFTVRIPQQAAADEPGPAARGPGITDREEDSGAAEREWESRRRKAA